MPRKVALLFLAWIAVAATASQKEVLELQKAQRPPSAENPVLEFAPFDPARTLPQFFAGSPVELEYLLFAGPRLRDSPPAAVYSFILPSAVFLYDADAGHMRLSLGAKTAHREGSSELFTALRAMSSMPGGGMMANVNGCGRDGLPPVYNILVLDQPLKQTELLVPMARDKAEEAQPHLRALVAVRLDTDAGYVLTQSSEDRAASSGRYTFRPVKNVRRFTDCELALGGNLDSIRVYDFRTGEQHASFTLTELGAQNDPKRDRAVAMKLAPAIYPDKAKRARMRGTVVAQVTIAADGTKKDIRILKSLPLGLDEAVEKAIAASSFEPAMRDGVPVDATVGITYKFEPRTGQGIPEQQ